MVKFLINDELIIFSERQNELTLLVREPLFHIHLCIDAVVYNTSTSEWEAEGIATAKAAGKFKGGKKRIDRDQVHQLRSDGLSTYKIAEQMGIRRMSVHRILNIEAT